MVDENLKQASSSSNNLNSTAQAAQHILLSPDGYYTYLQIPKPPTTTHKSLLSPSTPKDENDNNSSNSTIDKSKIEKNYRRLTLKLHPDRPGGDEESFRMLERAKCVLMSDKLRKEYDLLGLDLEEEEHHNIDQDDGDGSVDGEGEKKASSGNPDSIMSHMASTTVAGLLQLAVRTAMMAFVSLFLTRFKYTTMPAILFLIYTTYNINKVRVSGMNAPVANAMITIFDTISPLIIGAGIILMYFGRYSPPPSPLESDEQSHTTTIHFWTWTFWAGEALVMTMFAMNTIGKENSVLQPSVPLAVGFYVLSLLVCLWLRGKTWRYVTALGMEMGFALLAVLIFPVMEMILEEIMNEKLRKVGEKVRVYSIAMEKSYQRKLEEKGLSSKDSTDRLNFGLQRKIVELD